MRNHVHFIRHDMFSVGLIVDLTEKYATMDFFFVTFPSPLPSCWMIYLHASRCNIRPKWHYGFHCAITHLLESYQRRKSFKSSSSSISLLPVTSALHFPGTMQSTIRSASLATIRRPVSRLSARRSLVVRAEAPKANDFAKGMAVVAAAVLLLAGSPDVSCPPFTVSYPFSLFILNAFFGRFDYSSYEPSLTVVPSLEKLLYHEIFRPFYSPHRQWMHYRRPWPPALEAVWEDPASPPAVLPPLCECP